LRTPSKSYCPLSKAGLGVRLRRKMGRAWSASNLFSQEIIENAKRKLIPFDQSRLRREIKETAKQVLNREFELYELRKFFATWMVSQGVPESRLGGRLRRWLNRCLAGSLNFMSCASSSPRGWLARACLKASC